MSEVKSAVVANDAKKAGQIAQAQSPTYIVQPAPKRKSSPVVRKARYVDDKIKDGYVVFLSEEKEAAIFYDTPEFVEMLKFQDRAFETNKPEVIEYLRSTPQFGRAYWEKEYPPAIKAKLDRYAAELVREKSEIEIE